MKLKTLRLTLHRETLNDLSAQSLAQVEGGLQSDPQPLSSGPSWCGARCR